MRIPTYCIWFLVASVCVGCDVPREQELVKEADDLIGVWQVECIVRDGDCIHVPQGVVMEYDFTEDHVVARTIEGGKPCDDMTWRAKLEVSPRNDGTSALSFVDDSMMHAFRMNGILKHEQNKIIVAYVETDSCRPQSISDTVINGFPVTRLVLRRKR